MSCDFEPFEASAVKVVDELPLPGRKGHKHSFHRINEQVKDRLLEKQRMKQMCNRLASYDNDNDSGLFLNKFLVLESDPTIRRSTSGVAYKPKPKNGSNNRNRNRRKRKGESNTSDEGQAGDSPKSIITNRLQKVSILSESIYEQPPSSDDFNEYLTSLDQERNQMTDKCDIKATQEKLQSKFAEILEKEKETDEEELGCDDEELHLKEDQGQSDHKEELQHDSKITQSQLKQLEKDFEMYYQYNQVRKRTCTNRLRIWMLGLAFVALYAYTVKICVELFCPCHRQISWVKSFQGLFKP